MAFKMVYTFKEIQTMKLDDGLIIQQIKFLCELATLLKTNKAVIVTKGDKIEFIFDDLEIEEVSLFNERRFKQNFFEKLYVLLVTYGISLKSSNDKLSIEIKQ